MSTIATITRAAIDKNTTADRKLLRDWFAAPSTIGKAKSVTARSALVATPQIPLPNITAPMYLNGKPAAIAGVKRGDILIQLDQYQLNGMEEYMQTLGKLEKGLKTKLKIIREGKEQELEVQF